MRSFLASLWNVLSWISRYCGIKNPDTDEGFLTLLDKLCSRAFSASFLLRLAQLALSGGRDLLTVALTLLIGGKFYFSRLSVKQELAIIPTVFPAGRIPAALRTEQRASIAAQTAGFMMLYLFLSWVAGYLPIASAIMTIIACFDLWTRVRIGDQVAREFDDPENSPALTDPRRESISKRREVVRWYVALPHVWKEAGVALGSFVAVLISVSAFSGRGGTYDAGYATLLATHVLNEIVTIWWRVSRFVRLEAVDRATATGT